MALGGGPEWEINRYFSLHGEGYFAPDSFTSGVKAYNEASGGLRWKFRPLSVDVGYRYMQMEGKDGRRDNTGRWPLCRCRSELLTLRKGAFRPLYLSARLPHRRQHAAGDAQLDGDHRYPTDKHQRQRRRTAPDAILRLMLLAGFPHQQ